MDRPRFRRALVAAGPPAVARPALCRRAPELARDPTHSSSSSHAAPETCGGRCSARGAASCCRRADAGARPGGRAAASGRPVGRRRLSGRTLATIADPPSVLWVSGHLAALARPAVAIVGSRGASPARSRWLSAIWAPTWPRPARRRQRARAWHRRRGPSRRARAGGGPWPCSDRESTSMYPAEHRSLARDIAAIGAVVCELPPGTPAATARTSRCATGSSAACRGRSSSSRQRSGAASLITAACRARAGARRPGRAGQRVDGAAIAARTRFCATAQRSSSRPPMCWRSSAAARPAWHHRLGRRPGGTIRFWPR